MEFNFTKEADIISAIRAGNTAVFNHLKTHFYPVVRWLITKNSGRIEDAQDVFNEGLSILTGIIQRPELKMKSKVSSLLITICWKLWLSILRKKKTEKKYRESLVMEEGHDPLNRRMDEEHFQSFFWECFSKLKEDCQQLLRYYMEEKTREEISELMNLELQYVKRKKYLCSRALRIYIEEHPAFAGRNGKKGPTGN